MVGEGSFLGRICQLANSLYPWDFIDCIYDLNCKGALTRGLKSLKTTEIRVVDSFPNILDEGFCQYWKHVLNFFLGRFSPSALGLDKTSLIG